MLNSIQSTTGKFWHDSSRYGVIHYAAKDAHNQQQSVSLLIYVHGVLGNASATWGDMPSWVIKNANLDMDVISFSYPSKPWHRTSVSKAAYDLKTWIETEFTGYQHLIFVTHSTGGLVVKQLLNQDYQATQGKGLWGKTRQVINIAVPHFGGSPLLTISINACYQILYPLLVPAFRFMRFISQGQKDWGRNSIIPVLRWKNRWLLDLDTQFLGFLKQSFDSNQPTPSNVDIYAESDQSVPEFKDQSRQLIRIRGTHKTVKIPKRENAPIVAIVTKIVSHYPQDISLSVVDRTLKRIQEVNLAAGFNQLIGKASTLDSDNDLVPRRLSENRNLLRKSGFWPIFPIKFVKYSKYSSHLIKKMDSIPLSLATTSILGQPPNPTITSGDFGSQNDICQLLIERITTTSDRPTRIVVTGAGGVGKSTVLRVMTWRLGCRYLAHPETTPIPLFIPMQQVTASDSSDQTYTWENLWAWWLHWAHSLFPDDDCSMEWLENKFQTNPVVIIVDGLDDFLVNHSNISLSTIVKLLRLAVHNYSANTKLSIVIAIRNDVHGLDRLADDPSATYEILPLSRQQAIETFPACEPWVTAVQDTKERARNNLNNYGAGFLLLTKRSQEAHSCSTQRLRSFCQKQKDQPECSSYFVHVPKLLEKILTPLVLNNYQPTAVQTLGSSNITQADILNQIIETFLRNSRLVGRHLKDDQFVELEHLFISLSIIAWLFFCQSRGEIHRETLSKEASQLKQRWLFYFNHQGRTREGEGFIVVCEVIENDELCTLLLNSDVFISTGPKMYRFTHRNWQELLLARFFLNCIRYQYFDDFGSIKLYAGIYRMAGEMYQGQAINSEQVQRVIDAWRASGNTCVTANFIGFLSWTVTPIDAQAIHLLLEEFKNFKGLSRIILIGGLGYRILVNNPDDHSISDIRRAVFPKFIEYSNPEYCSIFAPVAVSLAWCYQTAFAKSFDIPQPDNAWPELHFDDQLTLKIVAMVATVTDGNPTLSDSQKSLQQSLLAPILETYQYPDYIIRAVHYLYILVIAEKHGVHAFAVSQELPSLLSPGSDFENLVTAFDLVPEVRDLYRSCQQIHFKL